MLMKNCGFLRWLAIEPVSYLAHGPSFAVQGFLS
jgi:hypothetical protein